MSGKRSIPIRRLLVEKAKGSACTYRVAAVAFDKKGNVLGHSRNRHADWNVLEYDEKGRPGTARHAERELMTRYAGVVRTIMICRVGHSGELLPIDPCPVCRKVAEKYGVKIVSVGP